MTLSGLALAVGILVDDATVTIENIERQFSDGKDLHQGILDGAQQIAVPALVSTLCISIVFVPMFFLTGVARYLFVPLAEAVVFALLASYFFSRTLIPTLVMYLLRAEVERRQHPESAKRPGLFARLHRRFEHGFETLREKYSSLLSLCLQHRRVFAACFLLFCARESRCSFHTSARTSSRRSTRASSGCICAPRPAPESKRQPPSPIRLKASFASKSQSSELARHSR